MRVVLGANANPLLTSVTPEHTTLAPLGAAASRGHLDVVRELMQHSGIRDGGGESHGVQALHLAARRQRVDIMAMLTNAGVVDTGEALIHSASLGRELSVKFLLQQHHENNSTISLASYVNNPGLLGISPLVGTFHGRCSPRARLLVDAGADTSSPVRTMDPEGALYSDGTPLELIDRSLREKTIDGEDATEEQLHGLEGTHRLLLRVEAVQAVSWLWHSDALFIGPAADNAARTKTASTPMRTTLPILSRRPRRRGALLGPLFRCAGVWLCIDVV